MTNPRKADDYLTLIQAAAAYRKGEQIFARAMVDSMEDPLDDALHLIGVLLAGSVAVSGTRGGVGYVVRTVHPN